MKRLVLMVTAAIVGAGAASAGPPPLDPDSHPAPGVLGTLDPATGRFTPDDPKRNSISLAIAGTINLVFNLDAKNVKSTSVVCVANIAFTDDGTYYGGERAEQFYPTFDSKNNRFLGTLPIDFGVSTNNTTHISGLVNVQCRYLNDPDTTIYQEQIQIDPLQEDNLVPVQGVMNDYSG